MAKPRNEVPPLTTVNAPKALLPLIEAFHVEDPKTAKALIAEAAKSIYGEDIYGRAMLISNEELDVIADLMRAIRPTDALESLYAAQIVVSHLLGLRRLGKDCLDDQRLGLNLLRFSNEAMTQLNRKRKGGVQNITVNYNHISQRNVDTFDD